MNDQEYVLLKSRVLKLLGIDLDAYKSTQMRRRLDSFVAHNAKGPATEFFRLLDTQAALRESLRNFITINVSEFFRDRASFEFLQTKVLPRLLQNRARLNIWSAGCSYGQEPYSLAMLLQEMAPHSPPRIVASDIDPIAIAKAKEGGPYTDDAVQNVPPAYYEKYFTGTPQGHFVSPKIKSRIEFKVQNLLNSRFEEGFDLILCRNVTIYFTDVVKNVLNRNFFNSLKTGGVLFIGGTEVILDMTKIGFVPLSPSFYLKPEEPVLPRRVLSSSCRGS
jgi:chemotaxis protein methyltransferase CheR